MGSEAVTLLMTATVSPPPDCPDLLRSDPQVRLRDYAEALQFYLSVPSRLLNRIVFAENSNYDLEPLKRLAEGARTDKSTEFLSYLNGNDFPPEYGKGYGEMTLMNYAVDHSKLISESDTIWKATGRLSLLNIATLIATAPRRYEVYCDLHRSYRFLGLEYFFDPRFFSFTVNGYNRFFRLSPEALQHAHIEHLYYPSLCEGVAEGAVVPRFRSQPMIAGHAGVDGRTYTSLSKMIRRRGQQVLRRIAPGLWI